MSSTLTLIPSKAGSPSSSAFQRLPLVIAEKALPALPLEYHRAQLSKGPQASKFTRRHSLKNPQVRSEPGSSTLERPKAPPKYSQIPLHMAGARRDPVKLSEAENTSFKECLQYRYNVRVQKLKKDGMRTQDSSGQISARPSISLYQANLRVCLKISSQKSSTGDSNRLKHGPYFYAYRNIS